MEPMLNYNTNFNTDPNIGCWSTAKLGKKCYSRIDITNTKERNFMKNLFKILIPFMLFLSGCSDDHNVIIDLEEVGVELKWIGCNDCYDGNTYEKLWYTNSIPDGPFGWDSYIECSEIILFQSDGYFNYSPVDDSTYVGFQYLTTHEWMWEEE